MTLFRFFTVALFAASLSLYACGGGSDEKKPSGPDHCAKLVEVGTKVCDSPDVKKYGAKMVEKCLQPYKDAAAKADQAKCKLLTPTNPQ